MGNTQASKRARAKQITDYSIVAKGCVHESMKKPDKDKKRKKKTSDLDELKSVMPHPYITGQGLKRETAEADPQGDSTRERESPTD